MEECEGLEEGGDGVLVGANDDLVKAFRLSSIAVR